MIFKVNTFWAPMTTNKYCIKTKNKKCAKYTKQNLIKNGPPFPEKKKQGQKKQLYAVVAIL